MSSQPEETEFNGLYRAIQSVLKPIAVESPFSDPPGDYFLVDDDWGFKTQKIELENLKLLHPDVVHALRSTLDSYPDWQIMIGVGAPGWPTMGITIRKHEIIDGLKREYFPPEYRGFRYNDARPGTERD